jgi:starvation-inducible DNA-binding protein
MSMAEHRAHVDRERHGERHPRREAREHALKSYAEGSSLAPRSIGLSESARAESVRVLVELQADTMTLRDLYKKHHWQASGASFYELHLLYDKHYREQVELLDHIAERIQALGGVSLGCPHDVADLTSVPRPPREVEETERQLDRLLEAHEIVLRAARRAARVAEEHEDDGTVNLVASELIPAHEQQAWFIGQQRGLRAGAGRAAAGRETIDQGPGRTAHRA